LAASTVGVGDLASVVRPEGIVESAASTGGAWGSTTLSEVARESKSANDGSACDEEGGEGDHGDARLSLMSWLDD
jgi:hypothetical protein